MKNLLLWVMMACLSIVLALSACEMEETQEILEQPPSAFSGEGSSDAPEQPLSSAEYAQAFDFYRELTSNYLDHLIAYKGQLSDPAVLLATSRVHAEDLGYPFSDSAFTAGYWGAISSAGTEPSINQDFWVSLDAYESDQQVLDAFAYEIERLGEPDEENIMRLIHLEMAKLTIEAIIEHPELLGKFQLVDNNNGMKDPGGCATDVILGALGGAVTGAAAGGEIGSMASGVIINPSPAVLGVLIGSVYGFIIGATRGALTSDSCHDE